MEVICGPMFSGKTEELLRRIRRAHIAKLPVALFKPATDTRYDNVEVVSATSKEKKIRSNLSPDISGVSAKTQQKPEYCDLGDLCRERG